MDLSKAILAYQQAAKFMGEAQAGTAAASEQYRLARDTEDAASRALYTARDQLLAEAEKVHLPGSPQRTPRPVKDSPQADTGRDCVDHEDTPPGYERE